MGRQFEYENNVVGSVNIIGGKMIVTFNTESQKTTKNFYKAEYTPSGTPPVPPTPTITYKMMQDGVDVTENIKTAIGADNLMQIKTVTSGGGDTQWENTVDITAISDDFYPDAACYKDGILYVITKDWSNSYKLYTSADDGTTFALKATITQPSDWQMYNTVHMEATENRILLFSFGYNSSSAMTSTYLVSTDNGTSWTNALLPNSCIWTCICQHNGTLILSDIGEEVSTIYRSTNEGLTWSIIEQTQLYRVAYSQNKFIGLLYNINRYNEPACTQIKTSATDGENWDAAVNIIDITTGLPSGTYVWNDMIADDQYIYISGFRTDVEDYKRYIIRSTDGGQSFSTFTMINLEHTSGSYAGGITMWTFNGDFLYSFWSGSDY